MFFLSKFSVYYLVYLEETRREDMSFLKLRFKSNAFLQRLNAFNQNRNLHGNLDLFSEISQQRKEWRYIRHDNIVHGNDDTPIKH